MQAFPTFFILLCTVTLGLGADWVQYLGSAGDNSSPEQIRTNWTEQLPKVVWRKAVGQGFSSVAVSGGKAVTLERRAANGDDREFCVARNANTGDELWATNLDAARYTNLSGYDDQMDGPRSTPTIEGDRVYVFTAWLKLSCLNAATGSVIWQRDFPAELGSSNIAWENAASPLLVGDLIYVNSNASKQRLMAIRKSDGTTAWGGQDDAMTHASPVYARIADTPQVIFLTRQGLVSVTPDTGNVLWRLGFTPSSTSTAASPAVVGDYVYASAAYGSGTWMARITQSPSRWAASTEWRQQGTAYQAHWSTPVSHDGFLYCVPAPSSGQGRLTCLDVATGVNRWTRTQVGSNTIGFGSVIKAGDVLIVLTEAGELVLVQPNPAAYTELGRFKALDRYCWNHVTLANGLLYARSTSASPELVALDVAPAAPAVTTLSLTAERTGSGSIKVIVSAADGSGVDPVAAVTWRLLSSPDLARPIGQWLAVPQPFTVTDGVLSTEIPVSNDPALYLRIGSKSSPP
jgi:outer membrane protein assembly factor BamB